MTDLRELWFESDGARLFAAESGAGRPIILLHGGLASHLACRLFAAPLTGLRVITPDLRASGRSRCAGPLAWDQLADDVAALARHLGLARAAIGGVSFGAALATRVALRHPALVDALIVLHPAYGGADLGFTPAQDAAMAAMDAAGRRAPAEGIGVLRPLADTLPPAIRDRARALFDSYDPASVAASTAFMASGAQPFAAAADLAAIAAPVLLVPGLDPTHPAEVADRYRAHLRDCTVREGDATTFATSIAAFLDGR